MIGMGAPLGGGRAVHRGAAPGGVANHQIGVNGIPSAFSEEIPTPDVSFDLPTRGVFGVMDKRRQLVSVLPQFLNVPWGKLIQVSQVKAERSDPARRWIDIDTAETAAKNLPQFPRSTVISGLGILLRSEERRVGKECRSRSAP